MATNTKNSTTAFLESIEPVMAFGPVNSDNLYSWCRFPYNGTVYFITPNMQYAVRISRTEDGKMFYDVATHNCNKAGRRPRYTFYLGGDNLTISVARLNAAMLIPGCIDKLIADPTLEINHKSYAITPEIRTVNALCYDLYTKGIAYSENLYTSGIDPNEAKRISLGRIKMINPDIYDAFILLTDNMTHKPFQLIDNRAHNLEICTKEENKAHYRMVTEFSKLQGSGIVKVSMINNIVMRRIPAKLALSYVQGKATRFAIAATILANNPIVPLDDVVDSMHKDRIVAEALSVLISDEYRDSI